MPIYDGKRKLNRSQNISMAVWTKQKSYEDRYKPIILKDYTQSAVSDPLPLKAGGLGPNIGSKEWMEEKLKRSRIRNFSLKLDQYKNNSLLMKRNL